MKILAFLVFSKNNWKTHVNIRSSQVADNVAKGGWDLFYEQHKGSLMALGDMMMGLAQVSILYSSYTSWAELKELYSLGLPKLNGFYYWRDKSPENTKLIKNALDLPINGLLSDLENGDFWCEYWDMQPDNIEEA